MLGNAFSLESNDFGQGRSLVAVHGTVGAPEARALEAATLESVLRGRRTVIVDLRGVTDVGAGLVGSILRMRRGLSGVRGDLALVVDRGPAVALVQATVLRVLVAVAATPELALEAIAPAPESFERVRRRHGSA